MSPLINHLHPIDVRHIMQGKEIVVINEILKLFLMTKEKLPKLQMTHKFLEGFGRASYKKLGPNYYLTMRELFGELGVSLEGPTSSDLQRIAIEKMVSTEGTVSFLFYQELMENTCAFLKGEEVSDQSPATQKMHQKAKNSSVQTLQKEFSKLDQDLVNFILAPTCLEVAEETKLLLEVVEYRRQHRLEQALETIELALKKNLFEKRPFEREKAMCMTCLGQLDEAAAIYEDQIVRMDDKAKGEKENYLLLYEYSKVLFKKGRTQEAICYVAESISLTKDPLEQNRMLIRKARYMAGLQDLEGAKTSLVTVIDTLKILREEEQNDGFNSATYELSIAYKEKGKIALELSSKSEAQNCFKLAKNYLYRIKEVGRDHPEYKELEELLEHSS